MPSHERVTKEREKKRKEAAKGCNSIASFFSNTRLVFFVLFVQNCLILNLHSSQTGLLSFFFFFLRSTGGEPSNIDEQEALSASSDSEEEDFVNQEASSVFASPEDIRKDNRRVLI